jgi:hypothetical protein
VACAILSWAVPAPAQEYFSDQEISHGGDSRVFAPPGYAQDGETPDWMETYNEYCQDGCDGSYGDCPSCGCSSDCIAGENAIGGRWWFGAEYLLWRTDSTILPPLVTESNIGTDPVLGGPTTQVIAGGLPVANHWRSGYKLELGYWLDDCNQLAIVGDYFNIGQDDYDFYFPGDSGRATGQPFFNTVTGQQDALDIAIPNELAGNIAISQNDEFQSTGVAIEQTVYAVGDISGNGPGTQVVILGGYRFYGYDSQLTINSTRTDIANPGGGSFETRRDYFASDNEFHGGELGVRARITQKACWFDGSFKLAIGGHSRRMTIDGASVIAPVNMPAQFYEGGLYTSSATNIGEYSDSRARLIPEFRLSIGVYLTPSWVLRAGYTAIVWSGVERAAEGLPPNLEVDPRNMPGGAGGGGVSPYFPGLGGSELVANGLDLGLEFNY